MNVRASFCVSKVGTIVSSFGEVLGLGPGVGMSVCAWIAVASAQTENPIQTFESLGVACRPLQRRFSQTRKLI
jgi:hypothetical protein